jgi:hypothetical protein
MIKLDCRAIAFLITSTVANMVVTTPVTLVSLLPALSVSTVLAIGPEGICATKLSMISPTVGWLPVTAHLLKGLAARSAELARREALVRKDLLVMGEVFIISYLINGKK